MHPDQPDEATCAHLLDVLGELVATGGPAPLLLPPVEPGPEAFPDPWAPSESGVAVLLRRLAWYAGMAQEIEIDNQRAGAPPTERKPATSVELVEVGPRSARFVLRYVGDDDVVGTLAHEIGVAHAVLRRSVSDPYRAAGQTTFAVDPEHDLEIGSIATVYLGLGTLAANAARQHHTVIERQGFHPLLVAPVSATVHAGRLTMESLGYLLAVQAVVRGAAAPPIGLAPEQRRAVEGWMAALGDRARELRTRLGIAGDVQPGERPAVVPFEDAVAAPDEAPRAVAFRWRTHRGGVGMILGTLFGTVLTIGLASRSVLLSGTLAGAVVGHLVGRGIRVPRCSACATVLPEHTLTCPRCGATLRGEISSLSERLDAEERLEAEGRD